jgi:hypothetical protein
MAGCAAGPEAPPYLTNVNGITLRVTRESLNPRAAGVVGE